MRFRFFKRGRIFYAQKYFLRCWYFRSLHRGRKQRRRNFESGSKNGFLVGYHLKSIPTIFWKLICWRLNFTSLKFWISEGGQTVDFSPANVLTGRGRFFGKKNFKNFILPVDFCPLKFRISESTWYRANAVHRNLTFPNPVICRKNVRCQVEGYCKNPRSEDSGSC